MLLLDDIAATVRALIPPPARAQVGINPLRVSVLTGPASLGIVIKGFSGRKFRGFGRRGDKITFIDTEFSERITITIISSLSAVHPDIPTAGG